MRKPIIAGNWKMHKTVAEAEGFLQQLMEEALPHDVEAVICAPFVTLQALVIQSAGRFVSIGAQNVHWEAEGAFTGEISVPMLQSLGVSYVIIGHSERRQYFQESDEMVRLKTKASLDGGLTPIVCVGESLEERENGETASVIQKQVQQALFDLSTHEVERVVIAYEPIWAIGTGQASTAEDAQEVCQLIRQTIAALWNLEVADQVRVQYGGSVKPDNIRTYLDQPDIDGALVGGASLTAASYRALLSAVSSEVK
ncbi:triosephosphate isomerase [Seinonella peptonophila]|uniref:Triosephosphate isomerase n=1 Tax=Seinonella peptonophila TaxID=112248 RepID=A0A1M4YMX1_9BACL|nr:triose-phosphate isomerase [Seinonella peptonophila]SHF07154.1 triosephosphate isomerase [Seinonella peptonophila]